MFRYAPSMVFPNPRLGWIAGEGELIVTRDGGVHWARLHLGGSVRAISQSGSSLWAFVAPCSQLSPRDCRYHLEAVTPTGTSWHQVGLLPAALASYTPLVVARLGPSDAVVALGQPSLAPAYLTRDGGRTWAPVRVCAPSGYFPVAVVATGRQQAWTLCVGGTAAGSSAKSLTRSTDGGLTWHVVAEDRTLMANATHPVPTEDGAVLAVPSPYSLWFAGVNSLWGSSDGGRSWSRYAHVDAGGAGAFAVFWFLASADGWLLLPGSGLWHTRDGRHWRPV